MLGRERCFFSTTLFFGGKPGVLNLHLVQTAPLFFFLPGPARVIYGKRTPPLLSVRRQSRRLQRLSESHLRDVSEISLARLSTAARDTGWWRQRGCFYNGLYKSSSVSGALIETVSLSQNRLSSDAPVPSSRSRRTRRLLSICCERRCSLSSGC